MKRKIDVESSEVESLDSGEDLSQKVKDMDLKSNKDPDYCDDQENSDTSPSKAASLSTGKVLGMARRFIPINKNHQEFKPMPRVGLSSYVPQKAPAKPFAIPKFTGGRSHLAGGVRFGNTLGMRRSIAQRKGPLHDPEEEGAIVLYVPKIVLSVAQQFSATFKKDAKEPAGEVHVVIDPILGKVLRPHQIEVCFRH